MEIVDKTTPRDIAYIALKAAIGSVPGVGSAASELFALVFAPPLEKRRQKWMQELVQRICILEEEGKTRVANLSNNEAFIDVVIQATSIALKNSEETKVQVLLNAVLNSAQFEDSDRAKSHLFLSLIDSFTTWHMVVLSFFNDPKGWFEREGQTRPNPMMTCMSRVLESAYPYFVDQDEFLDVIWSDLARAGLQRSTDLHTSMSGEGALASRTTALGKEFLKFISNH